MKNHAIWSGFNFRLKKSCETKVEVICSNDCPWRAYASWCQTEDAIVMKTLNDRHTCSRSARNRQADYKWIANHFLENFRMNNYWPVGDMMREMNHKFGITVGRTTCYKARSTVRKMLQGSLDDHYHLLPSYVAELRKVNENSTFKLLLDTDTPNSQVRFRRLYICFESLARGFLEGCRKFIGLDGCFLKSEVKGQLLSAVGKDGNNQMFPIAWAVVEGENEDSWTWFIELLIQDLGIAGGIGWTFMSDQQKGLGKAMAKLLPNAEHRNCAGEKRIVRKRDLFSDSSDQLCPRIRGLLEENRLKSRKCRLKYAGHYQFEVMIFGDGYVVDLRARKCSCRYWALRGIPCPHAIACIHWIKDDPENFVSDCYKRDMYQRAYHMAIPPMNMRNMWDEDELTYVFPLVKRQPGRPKMRRRVDMVERFYLNHQGFTNKDTPK
ncbi:uncharacterized protein LOC144702665 [Wolffia australiana]